jgi:uracil-DNA glycosylase
MLNIKSYSEEKSWKDKFPNSVVFLKNIKFHDSWSEMFDELFLDARFTKRIEKEISEELKDDVNLIIHPKPDYIFNAFILTKFKKTKVIILGQDPYFDHETHDDKIIPQAMGLSFSVPEGIKIPSSLRNIFGNLKKNKHIKEIPTHGNLEQWAKQGVLLLNTSLTVKDGTSNKNCHQFQWSWFTNGIIKYISDNKKKVIFVLWGNNALEKKDLIDENKHKIIISSHPSGLSANKKMKEYPAFNDVDHFGEINKTLDEWEKTQINWEI